MIKSTKEVALYSILLVFALVLSLSFASAFAVSHSASVIVNDNNGDSSRIDWENVTNALTINGIPASALLNESQKTSYLRLNDFNFSLPDGIAITGIGVNIVRKCDVGDSSINNDTNKCSNDELRLVLPDGSLGNDIRTSSSQWTSSYSSFGYGGPGDLWSQSWNASDINSANFGVAFSAKTGSNLTIRELDVDRISLTVFYSDVEAPVLNIPSDIIVEATSLSANQVNFSVNATDNMDTNPVVSCNYNSGDNFALGNTTVSCNATDSSGNIANGSFIVSIVDTTAPEIQLVGSNFTSIVQGTAFVDEGANATDNMDGNLTANITVNLSVIDVNTVGTYVLTYSVNDSSGNSASVNRTVEVTAAPIVNNGNGGGGGGGNRVVLNNSNNTVNNNAVNDNQNSSGNENTNSTSGNANTTPGITGAVIGGLGTGSWTVILIVVAVLAAGLILLRIRKKRNNISI